MKRTVVAAISVVISLLGVAPGAAHGERHQNPAQGVVATFEGTTIDLSQGWGDATACAVTAAGATCYRTEAEMDAAFSSALASAVGPLASSCASSLRLYDGASFSGSVLFLTTRAVGINLSSLGFDNLTSSYKVGACHAEFYSGANLSGSAYPGDTSAGAQAASMAAGWNNLVSSVIIY